MKKSANKDKPETKRSDFAKFVSAYRQIHGLSMQDMADKLRVSKTAVALTETDKFELPISFFVNLMPVLSVTERQQVQKMFNEAINRRLNEKIK
jgi:ribosome-binding protein aMBF1 (putative translation factor)